MISAYGREEVKKEAELTGIVLFLDKPVNPSLLYNSIMEIQGYKGFNKSGYEKKSNNTIKKQYSLYGAKLLLVEDNEINQQVASEILAGEGFEIEIARNGLEALEWIKRADKNSIDAILMDIQMPLMDGRETTRQIRALGGYWKKIPIIALTALSFEEENNKNLESGMNDRVNKPIEIDEIIEVLSRYIKPQKTNIERKKPIGKKEIETSIQIEGIHVKEGLARLMGNEKLYKDLLKSFRLKNTEVIETLKRNLENHDYQANMRIVHTIKGISSNLGINDLANCASRLEKSYKNEINDQKGLDDLELCLSSLLKAIDDYFEHHQEVPEEKQNEHFNQELINEALTKLLKEIRAYKTDAIVLAEELNQHLPKKLKEAFSDILTMINSLQYEEAEQAIMVFASENHFIIGEE